MNPNYVLIDFENVQPASLGALTPGEHHIKVFAGAQQSKVDLGLAKALQSFGAHAEYIQIVGTGKDALDFHIAFYIGKLSAEHPGASFTIVSRDTGFDPLVKHVATLGIACKRISALAGSPAAKAAAPAKPAKTAPKKSLAGNVSVLVSPPAKTATVPAAKKAAKVGTKVASVSKERIKEVLERLIGLKAARPGTVKTLRSSLKAWFKPPLSDADLDGLIDHLTKAGALKVTGTKVTYTVSK